MIARNSIRLIVHDLCVMRGNRLILRDVNFAIASGEALTLTGPNGAGKTTLLRSLAGFLPARSGSIRLSGGDDERSVGEQCHYVGHLNGIKPALSVAENLEFFANFLGGTAAMASRAGETLGLGDLEDVPAALLSAGQKRRLGLARLLCAERPLWLLDEPAVSLDAASQTVLSGMVTAHLGTGGIVAAATHTPFGWTDARTINLEPSGAELAAGAA
jgi:heme exporter protein A